MELANIDESKITAPVLKGKKEDNRTRLIKKLQAFGNKDPATAVEKFLKRGYFL